MTFPRNAPIEPDLIFLSKAVDVESQCITFASLPHLCVFGVECREIAFAKFLADQNDIDEMAMTFEVGGRKSGFGRETFIKVVRMRERVVRGKEGIQEPDTITSGAAGGQGRA